MHFLRFHFILCLTLIVWSSQAQCTYSCDGYRVSEIPFSMYPADGDTLFLQDDQVTTNMPIGFNFEFYCNTYNQLRICSNGFITFDFGFISASTTPYAQNLPSTVTPNGVIAWNWNDLDPSQGGSVTYTTTGVTPNQMFILTYSNVPLWTAQNPPSSLRNTGQIVLHEGTQLIEIHIKEAKNNGWLYHTEGIEDPAATKGVSLPGRNLALWTASLSSHLFSPYSTGPAPQISGDTLMCQGIPASYATTTLNNASGYQWSFPPGWSASGTQQTITAISGTAGVVSVAAIYTCGNSPPATLAVHVVPSPTVSLASAGPSLICSGSAFTLVPAGASFYTLEPGTIASTSSFITFPSSTVIYTLSGYSSVSGCNAVNTVTASVTVKPSPTISVNSGVICKGTSFTMVPTGASQYTFSSGFSVVSPPAPGIYSYSVWTTGSNGCVSPPAISIVSVAPLPVITIIPTRSLICLGEATTLLAMGAQSFTWTGLPGNSNTVSVSPPFSMIYSVIGKDANGCVNYGNGGVTVDKCTGIEEATARTQDLYPNPARQTITFLAASAGTYCISDQLGQILSRGSVQQGDNAILLPAKGILHFVFFSGSKIQTALVVSE
jgi:hypothetical protein